MIKAKQLVFLFLSILLVSCSADSEQDSFNYELIPVVAVDIPDELIRNENTVITTEYFRPTECHSFAGYDYQNEGNENIITILNVVVENQPCGTLENDIVEASFDFVAGQESSYVFKFWQGRNEAGENQYVTIEVPVVD